MLIPELCYFILTISLDRDLLVSGLVVVLLCVLFAGEGGAALFLCAPSLLPRNSIVYMYMNHTRYTNVHGLPYLMINFATFAWLEVLFFFLVSHLIIKFSEGSAQQNDIIIYLRQQFNPIMSPLRVTQVISSYRLLILNHWIYMFRLINV